MLQFFFFWQFSILVRLDLSPSTLSSFSLLVECKAGQVLEGLNRYSNLATVEALGFLSHPGSRYTTLSQDSLRLMILMENGDREKYK